MKRFIVALLLLFAAGVALAAVNLNTASKEELEALPGIGAAKAQAIIDHRKANGPFKRVEDVMNVKGIKEGAFNKIKGEISVSGASAIAAPAKPALKPAAPASAAPAAAKPPSAPSPGPAPAGR